MATGTGVTQGRPQASNSKRVTGRIVAMFRASGVPPSEPCPRLHKDDVEDGCVADEAVRDGIDCLEDLLRTVEANVHRRTFADMSWTAAD